MSGDILGHFAMRLYKGWRVHLFQVKDGGAGGVRLSAVCGGTPPWVRVHSGITPDAWESWKAAQAPIKDWPEWSTIKRVDCPRCERIYTKRRASHNELTP